MYYKDIHETVRAAAKEKGTSVIKLLTEYGIAETTYYRHLKQGTPWKVKDIDALSKITGEPSDVILKMISK